MCVGMDLAKYVVEVTRQVKYWPPMLRPVLTESGGSEGSRVKLKLAVAIIFIENKDKTLAMARNSAVTQPAMASLRQETSVI